MCGFAGFVGKVEDRETVLVNMMDTIIHRGPDSAGKYVDEDAALGFRRLSIIDLSSVGDQPLYNEDKSMVLVFNGEIYNYQELRKELIEAGHVFVSNTDSETLIHGYEQWGEKLVDRLRGMYAFVIWDTKKKRLFGARDIFGIKPFYYAQMNQTFLFASEIKAFMEHPKFDKIFNDNKNSRLIIATFASNVDRVQQIINSAVAYGRKVCVEGRSMVNIIEVAENLDYLKIPEGTLIDTEEMKNYPPEQIVLITTGSQGESMAALSRMAASLHRKVSIQPGDCVVFSSTPIPGNEKSVAKVINELGMKGAKVIFQDTHVSGHACQEEIKLIYSLVKPKYAIPVHGEYRHLCAQRDVVMALGYDKDHVFIAKSGDVIELSDDHGEIVGQVPTGAILVDGLGVGDVGNIVLRDRQNLAENGIIIVVLTLEKYTGNLVAGPDIVTRGFVYVREAEELLDEAKAVVEDSVQGCLDKHISDWSKIKNIIKDDLSEYLWKKMKRNPVILPIIMEAQM